MVGIHLPACPNWLWLYSVSESYASAPVSPSRSQVAKSWRDSNSRLRLRSLRSSSELWRSDGNCVQCISCKGVSVFMGLSLLDDSFRFAGRVAGCDFLIVVKDVKEVIVIIKGDCEVWITSDFVERATCPVPRSIARVRYRLFHMGALFHGATLSPAVSMSIKNNKIKH